MHNLFAAAMIMATFSVALAGAAADANAQFAAAGIDPAATDKDAVRSEGAQSETGSEDASEAGRQAAEADFRKREGTRMIREQGYFRARGDRLTFHLQGSEEKYACLENLALQRIAKVMSDRHDYPEQLVWEVSGFFTEYRAQNYLFITHAVLHRKPQRRVVLP